MSERKPTKKDKFDAEIAKLSKLKNLGYEINSRTYHVYLNNYAWKKFRKELENEYSEFYKNYHDGDGGELEEKPSRWGKLPPKMASVASSSRFIYLTLRDNYFNKIKRIEKSIKKDGEFQFEDHLTIKYTKSTPNLDASFKSNNYSLYFEAKCHELFDSHLLRWKEKYYADFCTGDFFGKGKTSLKINKNDVIKDAQGKPEKFEWKEYGKTVYGYKLKPDTFNLSKYRKLYLDVKQFVCHLLGIANDIYKNRELVYLYFKPKGLVGFKEEYQNLENQFKDFCESKVISDFCKINCIKLKLVYVINNSILDNIEFEEIYPNKRNL